MFAKSMKTKICCLCLVLVMMFGCISVLSTDAQAASPLTLTNTSVSVKVGQNAAVGCQLNGIRPAKTTTGSNNTSIATSKYATLTTWVAGGSTYSYISIKGVKAGKTTVWVKCTNSKGTTWTGKISVTVK